MTLRETAAAINLAILKYVKSGVRRGKQNAYSILVFSLVEKTFTDFSDRQFLAKDFYR